MATLPVLTKKAVSEMLGVFNSALKQSGGKFYLFHDVILVLDTREDEGNAGVHFIRNEFFTLPEGTILESYSTIASEMKFMNDNLGSSKGIYSYMTDFNVFKLSFLDKMNERLEISLFTPLERPNQFIKDYLPIITDYKFDDILDMYPNRTEITPEQLTLIKQDEVIPIGGVRVGKSLFLFIGVSRKTDPPNFTGSYEVGRYSEEENYVFFHMRYKKCEAIHMYLYVNME